MWLSLAVASLALWLLVLLLPWRPWTSAPFLRAGAPDDRADLSGVTVLIPARNEAAHLRESLRCVVEQGAWKSVVVVDDQSDDDTAKIAREVLGRRGEVLTGEPLPDGWSGKLWALQQAARHADSPWVLLLDADIALRPGIATAALRIARKNGADLVSLMATPAMTGFWDRLLMPAFVYFFKLLYPFRLANSRLSRISAAAGGFLLLRAEALDAIGGFASLRDALIDDCTLAARVKRAGHRTWIGLSRDVISLRPCRRFGAIREMVARTAYTQLRDSVMLLVVCTGVMGLAFVVPVAAIIAGSPAVRVAGGGAWIVMGITYLPVLRFYALPVLWAMTLPVAGVFYLEMTWASAVRSWYGRRASWRGRTYSSRQDAVNRSESGRVEKVSDR
ncbi:MAG: glycosyltransferase [Pseudomonadota bacterium]|nr:glycosyltransferase [Pseudomonadota bacterium]